jgi:hypothetical protein
MSIINLFKITQNETIWNQRGTKSYQWIQTKYVGNYKWKYAVAFIAYFSWIAGTI